MILLIRVYFTNLQVWYYLKVQKIEALEALRTKDLLNEL